MSLLERYIIQNVHSEQLRSENSEQRSWFWYRCGYLRLAFIILCDEAIGSASELRVKIVCK